MHGESLIAIFPTGGGKSLTFQLPALISGELSRTFTVMISPLQSLMKDQVDNLGKRGIAGKLLDCVVKDCTAKGISPLYLITGHTGFYERYGWQFLCMVQEEDSPKQTRMYIYDDTRVKSSQNGCLHPVS